MSKEDILTLVGNLAMSQGFYGRLLISLNNDPDYLEFLANMNFKSNIDFIMYMEC